MPEAIKQRKPPYNQLWCWPAPTNRIMAIAKNRPERVGRMTLPSQLVRFTIPFSNMDLLHHVLNEPPERGYRQEAQRGRNQPHRWTVSREINDRRDDGQSRGCRHDLAGKIVPESVQNIDRGEPARRLQVGYQIRCGRYCEQE